MTQRLQDILGKLYRTHRVFALFRSDTERLPLLPSIAVISITAPARSPTHIGDFAHVLRLSFSDVDFLNSNLSEKARSKFAHVFTEEHGQAIRSFVEELPGDICR
ncbi:hypothetical protein ACNRBH_17885 [Ralstonia pseudosolanacearum]|uniref:hypothetical protein n=1 Tax=Ralstonia pseudosolanacearum TaxID=1310165 RepID=UPI003AADD586